MCITLALKVFTVYLVTFKWLHLPSISNGLLSVLEDSKNVFSTFTFKFTEERPSLYLSVSCYITISDTAN